MYTGWSIRIRPFRPNYFTKQEQFFIKIFYMCDEYYSCESYYLAWPQSNATVSSVGNLNYSTAIFIITFVQSTKSFLTVTARQAILGFVRPSRLTLLFTQLATCKKLQQKFIMGEESESLQNVMTATEGLKTANHRSLVERPDWQ